MVYESDFYSVRRPYTRPTITSYSVTAARPCMSIRGLIAPPGTHSKVRMSVLLGELNRIQHRHRPHLAIVPTEDFLCSRPLVDFDDEAKHIRAAADKLIRYVHTSVPHETRHPVRIITAYDRYAPEGRYVSKYSPDIPTNIQCMSYYTEPSRVTIGRGHLACVSFAGGRGYPRRKHLYNDEIRDIGDEIKFRSYYARNVHPSRNDDALLLPTGFASRILLPDRRLVGTEEGRALVFQSKLIKPVSSGLSIKREKPEKKPEKSAKQKSRSQAIEEQILAEESARAAAAKPVAKVVEVVELEEPPKDTVEEEEPAPQITRQLSTPAVPEPEPEPPKEATPPPADVKPKPRKDSKKKSSMKAPSTEVEPLVETAPVVEPVVAEEPKAVEEVKPAETPVEPEPETQSEAISDPEPTLTPDNIPEEPKEEPKVEPIESPVESEQSEKAESVPTVADIPPVETEPSQPEEISAPTPIENQAPAEEPVQETPIPEPEVIAEPAAPEVEEPKVEEPAVDESPLQESPLEPTVSEDEGKAPVEEVSALTESECVEAPNEAPVETSTAEAEIPIPTSAIVEEAKEELTPVEDPQSRLEAAPEAEAETTTPTVAEVTPAEPTEPVEPQPQTPSDEPVISEVEGTASTEILPETTEPIVEEPPSPVTEQ